MRKKALAFQTTEPQLNCTVKERSTAHQSLYKRSGHSEHNKNNEQVHTLPTHYKKKASTTARGAMGASLSHKQRAVTARTSPSGHTCLSAAPIALSFQLIIRAEPVELVLATLRSLLAIKQADDEIIIIDNNHTQAALYEPLARYCADLDQTLNVHFYHIDAVAGFKAGALNLALGLMNPNCTHVVVVDSDYQALPHARAAIMTAINRYPEHGLLQFPQFYRDANRGDIHSELNHYFNHHLNRAVNRTRALSTGTYAVIRRRALLDIGGWSGASITEDAQMGVLLHRSGWQSRFVPEVIATGLLPTTLCDLVAQRQRWVYGNAQVLNSYFSMSSFSSPIRSKQTDTTAKRLLRERLKYGYAHFSQLSAWINGTGVFILLQAAVLLIVLGALLIGASMDWAMVLTPLYLVYGAYGLFVVRRLWAYCRDGAPLNQQVNHAYKTSARKKLRAWALHLSLWEIGALAWWPVLWGRDKPFVCTPKQQKISTQHRAWMSNIAALPKLLLILNVITAVVLSPLSPLYAPILFACALTVTLLKLWSAKVAFENYSSDNLFEPEVKKAPPVTTKTVQNKASTPLKQSLTARFHDEKVSSS